jgi:hypothetical protein
MEAIRKLKRPPPAESRMATTMEQYVSDYLRALGVPADKLDEEVSRWMDEEDFHVDS